MLQTVWEQVVWAWRQVLPHLKEAWEASKPYFHQLGKVSENRDEENKVVK